MKGNQSNGGTHCGSLVRCLSWALFLASLILCFRLSEGAASQTSVTSSGADPKSIRYNRDIRPILSDHCFQCHGPDASARKAGLRLDQLDHSSTQRSGKSLIIPGDPLGSGLYHRVTAVDESDRMPPVDSGKGLSPDQLNVLRQWILEGGEVEPHWAFVRPKRPALPPIADRSWVNNAIDHFVLARLEREGWRPSARANKRQLIRRVTLDLTGLPPTLADIRSFLADASPDAYGMLVDRLLASPRYGEHMALEWLDAARYADTHGYLFDTERYMWRWRDWVINAFNSNQPFDAFTVEQLAGDLLPQATLEQRIATGFNRNHIINNEAGATPTEYLVENIVDRVNTTATVWMGLTVACAQCHDHKYDPISQREYYQLFAFFNNVPELGLDGFNANARPLLPAPTDYQQESLAVLEQELAKAEREFASLAKEFAPALKQWQQKIYEPIEAVADPLVRLAFDGGVTAEARGLLDASIKDGVPSYEEGLFGQSVALDGQRFVELGDVANFDRDEPFTLRAWVYPTRKGGRLSVFSRMAPPEISFRGYTLQIVEGFPALFLVHQFPQNLLQVQAKKALEPHRWHHIVAVYDGSGKTDGAKLFVNGDLADLGIKIDTLTKSIDTENPFWIGNGYPAAKFVGRIDETQIFDRALSDVEVGRLPGLSIHSLLQTPQTDRSDEQALRIRNHYLETAAPKEWRQPYEQVVRLRAEKKQAMRTRPTVMVMNEAKTPRLTRMLIRGAYNQPGDVVAAGTPSFLPTLSEGLPKNRLGLARWLVDPQHPLTARVIVNRYWQRYFGEGLVRTPEDFGRQGDSPTHPDLLDWMATEFVESGWNVKHLQRLILTSATYQQTASAESPDLLRRDPENRLLARGARFRLAGESIRDLALATSGLLVEKQGGPSVKPYQPRDLWREVAFDVSGGALTAQRYEQDKGAALYRRSLYTFRKRTAPPPNLLLFDGPDWERCVVRRERTNTPLQALVLMNDPSFVEAARKLAERLLYERVEMGERIALGFEIATGRLPKANELQPLVSLCEDQIAQFSKDRKRALALLSVGESGMEDSLPSAELAAYTLVASILLSLDETITKG